MYMLFLLLIIFQIKHFLADYLLQGEWALSKFKRDWSFFMPLLAHAGVHGAFTLAICLIFNPWAWWLAIVDVVSHFIIDRIKAGPKYLGRFKALSGKEMVACQDIMREINYRDNLGYDKDSAGFKTLIDARRKETQKLIFNNKMFWFALGLDQISHFLIQYLLIAIIVGAI